MEKKETTIDRAFNLLLETVWKVWSEPENAKKWIGPECYTTPGSLRVGDSFQI